MGSCWRTKRWACFNIAICAAVGGLNEPGKTITLSCGTGEPGTRATCGFCAGSSLFSSTCTDLMRSFVRGERYNVAMIHLSLLCAFHFTPLILRTNAHTCKDP